MSNEALRVDLVTAAKDEASASLAKTNAELRELQENIKGTAAESLSTGSAVTNLGTASKDAASVTGKAWAGVEGVDKVKQGFEKLRGAIAFLPGVIGLAAGAVATLTAIFDDGDRKLEEYRTAIRGTRDILADLEKGAAAGSKAVEDLTLKLAQLTGNKAMAAELEAAKELAEISSRRGDIIAAQVVAEIALNKANVETVRLQTLLFDMDLDIAALRRDGAAHQRSERDIQASVAVVERRRLDVAYDLRRSQRNAVTAAGQMEDALKRQLTLAQSIERAIRGMASQPFLNAAASARSKVGDEKPDKPKKPRGGGGRGSQAVDTEAQAMRALQMELAAAQGELARAEQQYTDTVADLAAARISTREREAREMIALMQLQAAQERYIAEEREKADAEDKRRRQDKLRDSNTFAEAMTAQQKAQQTTISETGQSFRDAIGSIDDLTPKLHDYLSAMSNVAQEAAALASAHKLTKEGVLGLIGASGKATAALIDDTQARALVEALLYAGLGAAYLAIGNIPQGLALEGASAMLFVAAATGGAGGKKGSSSTGTSTSGGGDSGGSGGSITNVWNISGGAADPMTSAALHRRVEYAQRHTGFDQRSPGW